MTNQYIITEEQLQRGQEFMSKTGRKKYEKEIRSNPYNPKAERDCPVCGGGLVYHRWCIDRDCGWDSIKEHRQIQGGE